MFSESAFRTRRDARSASGTGAHEPPSDLSREEQARSLLRTAATYRPVDEVAALVAMLKETGEVPNPADEALGAAALSRSVDEVAELVALLGRPPHDPDAACAALRSAAVSRPVDEVTELVRLLGRPPHGPEVAEEALRAAALGRPVEEVVHLATLLDRPEFVAVPEYLGDEELTGRFGVNGTKVSSRAARSEDASGSRGFGSGAADDPGIGDYPLYPPDSYPYLPSPAGCTSAMGDRAFSVERALGLRGRHADGPLRSVLRWPAAAALAVCGLLHLPSDFPELNAPGYGDVLSVLMTGLCLFVAVCLAGRDSVRVWMAGVAAAAGVTVVHILATTPALSSLGLDDVTTAPGIAAVGFAVLGALLAGTALLWHPRRADVTG